MLLAIEGYVTLPSGVIIEWGSISYPESKDYISNVYFLKNPITVIAAFISEENTQTGGAQYRGGSTIKHSSVSSTGMTIQAIGSVRKLYCLKGFSVFVKCHRAYKGIL